MDKKIKISLIAAMTGERVIGDGLQIPWRIPEDQQLFKDLTINHPVIMGRMTWQSLPAPLIRRRNIVVSRSLKNLPEVKGRKAELAATLEEALVLAADNNPDEIFIIGGAQIYSLALPLADRLYISRIRKDYRGNILFPAFSDTEWPMTERKEFKEFILEIRDRENRI